MVVSGIFANMNKGELVIYNTQDGSTSIDVKLEDDSVWLNRHQMSLLFDRDMKTIGRHVNNALKEELQGVPTVAKFATVQIEGKRSVISDVEHYNLNVIISAGYRLKSQQNKLYQ